jgi:GH18 family chitinase
MQTSISHFFTWCCDFRYLDFINVMTYDLHGSWDGVTGENSPLYAGTADITYYQQELNVVSIRVHELLDLYSIESSPQHVRVGKKVHISTEFVLS